MSFLPILICYYVLFFNIYYHFFDEKWPLWGLRHSLYCSVAKCLFVAAKRKLRFLCRGRTLCRPFSWVATECRPYIDVELSLCSYILIVEIFGRNLITSSNPIFRDPLISTASFGSSNSFSFLEATFLSLKENILFLSIPHFPAA